MSLMDDEQNAEANAEDLRKLRVEHARLTRRLADLETVAQCAEEMRDKADADYARMREALEGVLTVVGDWEANKVVRIERIARAALSESEEEDA